MKKIQKVCVKTVVMGRSGRSVVRTPLSVDIPTTTKYTSGENMEVSCVEDHVEEEVFDLNLNSEDSAAYRRNINSRCNWEKIRLMLIKARLEDYSFPENAMCGVCANDQAEACIRCQYCGPKQFFCETCALKVHEIRNQFHVMEKWMVIAVQFY